MILNVISAEYKGGYQVFLTFNNGDSILTDLKDSIFKDARKILIPLKDLEYFKTFKIKLNTITWENEADFAPEFLIELGKQQMLNKLNYA
ncbi:MAG: DUF2442 domain-containing protein [Salinivirgaceae bacterium]|jgi:hypothetical protein